MTAIPICSSREIVRAMERAGFVWARTKGSHATYTRRDADARTRVAVIPISKREVPTGTLANVLRQAGMSVDEFCGYLR